MLSSLRAILQQAKARNDEFKAAGPRSDDFDLYCRV